jgi:uncharacterized membrane protein YeaQ/YmgE (transglycosylase-associated protein family)
VLSALPFVSMCCCLWVIAGACTTYLLPERSTGLLAGVIGAILATVLSQILAMPRGVNVADAINDLIGQGRMPPEMTGALEQ